MFVCKGGTEGGWVVWLEANVQINGASAQCAHCSQPLPRCMSSVGHRTVLRALKWYGGTIIISYCDI